MPRQRDFALDEELKLVRNRYANVTGRFPHTLARLAKSQEFIRVYRKLKDTGLKDWHILQGVANITIGYRTNYGRGKQSFERLKRDFLELFNRAETEADLPVPVGEYSFDNMQIHINSAMLSYIVTKGHVLKSRTPNFQKLREFADKRYRYFQVDTDHSPPFG